MKKYVSYILILVTLAGLLVRLPVAEAESPACYSMPSAILNPNLLMSETCPAPYYFWGTKSDAEQLAAVYKKNGTCTYVPGDDTSDPQKATNFPCVNGSSSNTTTSTRADYKLLAPLPGLTEGTTFDKVGVSGSGALGDYINVIIKLAIGIMAVMAMVMIVMGGIQYMTSELVSSKEEGKHRITNAVFGLLIALGAWLILFTINPDLLNTNLNIASTSIDAVQTAQIKSYSGNGQCTPISDTSNPCSPSNLATAGFPNGDQASSICNGESKGNPTLASGVDLCSDGTPFSYGLFQINIIAHANDIPGGVCSNIFQVNGFGTQGTCLASKNGICIKHDCTVKDSGKLQSCVNFVTDVTNNIKFAVGLQKLGSGWNQWGAYNSCKSQF